MTHSKGKIINDVYPYILPILSGPTEKHPTEISGTAWSIGAGFFITAGHAMRHALSCKWKALGHYSRETDKVKIANIADSAVFDSYDVAIFKVIDDNLEAKAIRWSEDALATADSVRTVGYAYRNVEILDAGGRRSHVERIIEPVEAAVIRRIFHLSAAGHGMKAIAKTLNAEGAPSPRAQRGRPRTWAPSSVWAALHRPVYRGELLYAQTAEARPVGAAASNGPTGV
jgi:hypothetical protein